MLIAILTYITLALGALIALATMILRIGALMAACPEKGAAARTVAMTVATGFAAIASGGVLLIGAVLPLFARDVVFALPVALGLAALCLGLGFTQAVSTLRDALNPRPAAPVRPGPAAAAAHPA